MAPVTTEPLTLELGPALNRFGVFAYQRGGGRANTNLFGISIFDLTDYVTSMSISDSFQQAGAQLQITLDAPPPMGATTEEQPDLRAKINLGMPIVVFGAFASPYVGFRPLPERRDALINAMQRRSFGVYGDHELFRGFIFVRDVNASPVGDTITLTAYDHLTYLARNRYDAVYKGRTARQIILDICKKAGLVVDIDNFEDTRTKLSTLKAYDMSLWDVCTLALQRTRLATRGAPYYFVRSRHGKVQLLEREYTHGKVYGGAPAGAATWTLRGDEIILSADHSVSLENVTTGAQFVGALNSDARRLRSTWSNAQNEQLYGRMFDVVNVGGMTQREITRTRKNYILEHAKPEETISVTMPCLNQIRLGDAVLVYDDLRDESHRLWVRDLTHTMQPGGDSTTQLTLARNIAQASYAEVDEQAAQRDRQSWSRIKGLKYTGIKITRKDFVGAKLRGGGSLSENDAYCTVAPSSPFAKYKRLSIDIGSHSRQVEVVKLASDPRPNGDTSVHLSLDVCRQLKITTGSTVEVYPLKSS